MNAYKHYEVKPELLDDILQYVRENNTVIRNAERRKQVIVENLMLRAYLNSPEISYSVCRKTIQPFCEEYDLTDADIKMCAQEMNITERSDRIQLVEWTLRTADWVCQGLAGDNSFLNLAQNALKKPYSPERQKVSPLQYRTVLFCLFEMIPRLREGKEHDLILQFGKQYSKKCLTRIMSCSMFDNAGGNIGDTEYTVEQLRRELYIARQELIEYKELTEAADAEFDDKLTEMTQREIAAFFSQLNSQKYGYLVDSVLMLVKACKALRKKGEELPYELEPVPVVLERLIEFLRDVGIAPACKYPPDSIHKLSPAELEGSNFEADPQRKTPLTEKSVVSVKVVSSGWKYRGVLIAPPVFREIYEEENP